MELKRYLRIKKYFQIHCHLVILHWQVAMESSDGVEPEVDFSPVKKRK